MNITRENINDINEIIKISIEKTDYEQAVNNSLKEHRQKASIPGFRPGKVPASIIKKRFGIAILVDEVNKLLSHSLSEYLVNEKLNILGEPLPNEEQQKNINWDTDENFEFVFDIAPAPEVKIILDKNDKIEYYNITVSEEMINQQVDMVASQFGKNIPVEEIKENSSVRGDFFQLDENGNEMENGINPKGVYIAVELIKNEDIKSAFVGRKIDDVLVFDPVKALENRHDVGHMLNIKNNEAETLNSDFKFSVTEILQYEKAELNDELFKKLYGEETEIKTIEDFRDRIKKEISTNLKHSSEYKFGVDIREALIGKTTLTLPEAFLKRWLVAINKDITEEQIENEFQYFIKDLKWQLIKDSIITEDELKVNQEEILDFAKQLVITRYNQYGIYDLPEEKLDSFANAIIEKREESEQIVKKLFENKVIDTVREKIEIIEREVTQDEFNELMK
ncbi:MAG: trigger factor [Bacteroidales bacterium]|jgi:trigger factor|nr:trigger factor [Bacteroidales bacterium]